MSNRPIFFDSETKASLLKIADSMDDLIASIEKGATAANIWSGRLVWLTFVLVGMTAAILILTAVLAFWE